MTDDPRQEGSLPASAPRPSHVLTTNNPTPVEASVSARSPLGIQQSDDEIFRTEGDIAALEEEVEARHARQLTPTELLLGFQAGMRAVMAERQAERDAQRPPAGSEALRLIELFENLPKLAEAEELRVRQWKHYLTYQSGVSDLEKCKQTYKDCTLRKTKLLIQEKLQKRYVFVLQKMPPAACKIKSTYCAHPFCSSDNGRTPHGAYRLSLEPSDNVHQGKVPAKPLRGHTSEGKGEDDVTWYCLTCVEDLWNEIALLPDDEFNRQLAANPTRWTEPPQVSIEEHIKLDEEKAASDVAVMQGEAHEATAMDQDTNGRETSDKGKYRQTMDDIAEEDEAELAQIVRQVKRIATLTAPDKEKENKMPRLGLDGANDSDGDTDIDQQWQVVSSPETNSEHSSRLGVISVSSPEHQTHDAQHSPTETVETWCCCGGPDDGSTMVACEAENCEIGWWHLECLELKEAPQEEYWVCPACVLADMKSGQRRQPTKAKSVEADEETELPSNPIRSIVGPVDGDDPHPYPFEGLYADQHDKDEISSINPELSRELELARRQEIVEMRQARIMLKERARRQHANRNLSGSDSTNSSRDSEVRRPFHYNIKKGTSWTFAEESVAIRLMKEMVKEGKADGDRRWKLLSRRMFKYHGIDRSEAAVKIQWNRFLREKSGIDERKPSNNVTRQSRTSLQGSKSESRGVSGGSQGSSTSIKSSNPIAQLTAVKLASSSSSPGLNSSTSESSGNNQIFKRKAVRQFNSIDPATKKMRQALFDKTKKTTTAGGLNDLDLDPTVYVRSSARSDQELLVKSAQYDGTAEIEPNIAVEGSSNDLPEGQAKGGAKEAEKKKQQRKRSKNKKKQLEQEPESAKKSLLTAFQRIYSFIQPELREHGSGYYQLNAPRIIALSKWKDVIMRIQMFEDEKNRAFMERNGLHWKYNLADPEAWVNQSEHILGAMDIGGLVVEVTTAEVICQDLSTVLAIVDGRVQVELDIQGWLDGPYVKPKPSVKLIVKPKHLMGSAVDMNAQEGESSDDEWSSSDSDEDMGEAKALY